MASGDRARVTASGVQNRAAGLPRATYEGLKLTASIPACRVSLADLRRLYRDLGDKAREALDRQLAGAERPADKSEEEFEGALEDLREAAALRVFIFGGRGEQVVADSVDALHDERLPDSIDSIIFDSSAGLQRLSFQPLNRFRLVIDFTEPPNFNAYNPWDSPTPNNSQLEVIGPDTTWVTAVNEQVREFFRHRGTKRSWFHGTTAFNVLNWLLGFPVAFWLVYRLDGAFAEAFGRMPGVLRGAVYVYVVLVALLAFRQAIAGLRWTFPLVELDGARSKKARTALSVVLTALGLALLYDVLKTLFSSQ